MRTKKGKSGVGLPKPRTVLTQSNRRVRTIKDHPKPSTSTSTSTGKGIGTSTGLNWELFCLLPTIN